jgi:2-oxoglutarate dehydrogenase E2 component (dihydrolipoamide succinyltransferase)
VRRAELALAALDAAFKATATALQRAAAAAAPRPPPSPPPLSPPHEPPAAGAPAAPAAAAAPPAPADALWPWCPPPPLTAQQHATNALPDLNAIHLRSASLLPTLRAQAEAAAVAAARLAEAARCGGGEGGVVAVDAGGAAPAAGVPPSPVLEKLEETMGQIASLRGALAKARRAEGGGAHAQ